MHCQICNAYSDKDIAEYNEQTGKIDFICGKCNDSHHESRSDYHDAEDEAMEDAYEYWDDGDEEEEEHF